MPPPPLRVHQPLQCSPTGRGGINRLLHTHHARSVVTALLLTYFPSAVQATQAFCTVEKKTSRTYSPDSAVAFPSDDWPSHPSAPAFLVNGVPAPDDFFVFRLPQYIALTVYADKGCTP